MTRTLILILLFLMNIDTTNAQEADETAYNHFVKLITSAKQADHLDAYSYLARDWKTEYNIIAIELAYLTRDREIESNLIGLLSKNTKQNYGYKYNEWYQWLWSSDQKLAPFYHKLKGLMHRTIDTHFLPYFLDRQETAEIRLDEVRWGGVKQDGIPPLRKPVMLKAEEADYLKDDNIVFGIEINGDFRAYPKRILAWHEMFVDTVGDVPVAGVYCTLCGTVILYKTEFEDKNYEIGTSGFLYRSNKLMYDKETQSLWSTLEGKPVIGPLVGKGIELEFLSTVTTTWGEWKKLHPTTIVLDVNTGYERDYGEGVAYNTYFSSDRLMFNIPKIDTSLKNKESILAIKLQDGLEETIAISVDFLKKNPIYEDKINDKTFVVLTDASGANRVYFSENVKFSNYKSSNGFVLDNNNQKWTVYEDRLEQNGKILGRLHSFNAFWFGWKAQYPNTKLIK